ncbi:hypothetical protein ACJ2A9_17160 [Anaerobacillus sp. MEB173]|uniref:hypothetical protein n=1 Tax=Anaerobacillus sp. MEB173 TaxID=3383345 RepID=UPI003F8EA955
MTYHDFIASIMIGSIAGNLAFNTSISTPHILVALFFFIIICIDYPFIKTSKY